MFEGFLDTFTFLNLEIIGGLVKTTSSMFLIFPCFIEKNLKRPDALLMNYGNKYILTLFQVLQQALLLPLNNRALRGKA